MSGVVLPGGRTTSRVGFGCAALVGGRSRREALDLLERALDAGITHFDVARVYGTGDAEEVVGAFAAAHPGEVTIATKFGIDPVGRSAAAGASKHLLRAVTRRSRRALRFARRYGGATVKRGRFTPEHACTSLATSLGALATDHVDLFLLHDCTAGEWEQPELLEVLDDLRRSGAIGAYGPATHADQVAEILRATAHPPAVAQLDVDGSVEAMTGPTVPALVVTHGALRHLLPGVAAAVADPATAREWSRDLDLDASDVDNLASLLLGRALAANPAGIVLVSTGDPDRLARHGAAASAPCHPPEQLAAFAGLLAAVVRPAD